MAQPYLFPHAYNANRAEKIRKAVNVPVTCVGSVINLEMADRIIAEGKADIVAMGRAQVADPELVNKTCRGESDDIRPCLRCNVCGEKPMYSLPVRCAVNPVTGREVEYRCIKPAGKKKRVVIVGGGPAGMEAAITASSRGHDVTLLEKKNELGGALRIAASPSFKADMKRFLEWMIRKTESSKVEIRLSTKGTIDLIADLKPDVLIMAVGAEPFIPSIPGIGNPNVAWAGDVDSDKVETGKTILIAGTGLTGCETALLLAQQGKKVTVIDMLPETEIAKDAGFVARIKLMEMLNELGVQFRNEVRLEEISDNGVIISDKAGNRNEMAAETVVLSLGVRSLNDGIDDFRGLAREIHVIGDCANPGNLMSAIHNAFNITAEI